MKSEDIPMWLRHKPIISAAYEHNDADAGDAKFLSIGKASWNNEDVSAKIWRKTYNTGKWSRQSEEIPLWRVLDLAKLLIATISHQQSSLDEIAVSKEEQDFLNSFINDNMKLYIPRMREIKELLNTPFETTDETKEPNIFSYATSELSQDAVLCWLIKWADDNYKSNPLCMVGKSLLSKMTGLPKYGVHTVKVHRQWKNIDVLVEINADSVLVIEDKTGTSFHDNQLLRYKECTEKYYKGKKHFYAYIKTGNEPLYKEETVKKQSYKIIDRRSLLEVLNDYKGSDTIVVNFRSHLQSMEDETNAFWNKPISHWDRYQWQGFFKELEKKISVIGWDYVHNPLGGFFGLWWHFKENVESKVKMYLQFEQKMLCIKIEYKGDKAKRSNTRNKCHAIVMEEAEKAHLPLKKPSRFGAGSCMTVGVVEPEDIFGNGLVNISSLVEKLSKYEKIVDSSICRI